MRPRMPLNRALRALIMANAIILIAGAMLGPIYAIFVKRVGGNLLDAGLTGGIYSIAAGITALIVGKLDDKLKKDRLMVALGSATMGAVFLLYIMVDSVVALFIVQALAGFAGAFYWPSFYAVYSKHLSKSKVGRGWGAWQAVNYFSTATGAAIGGFLAASFGFKAVFIMMATLCFVSAAYIYLLPKKVLLNFLVFRLKILKTFWFSDQC